MDNVMKEIEDNKERKRLIQNLIKKRLALYFCTFGDLLQIFMKNETDDLRTENFDYLKRIYQRDQRKLHWLNIALVDTFQLRMSMDDKVASRRAKEWFTLGVNLAPLVKIGNTPTYVRSLAQMMEEYDYYISNNSAHPVIPTMKKASINLDNEFEAVKPKLHRIGNTVAYEFLTVYNIPCELDYFEIIYTLCEVLKMVYNKFEDDTTGNKHIYETITKLDLRLKNFFFGKLERDMHKLAKKNLSDQTSDLDALYKAWETVGTTHLIQQSNSN